MRATGATGYELCYLGARQSVPVSVQHASVRGWLGWGRTAFAVAVVIVLIVLGVANIAMYSRWHEVEDGVLWGARAEGVTALDVAAGSPAVAAGIQRGDVLLAVDGSPVESPADVIEFQHRG